MKLTAILSSLVVAVTLSLCWGQGQDATLVPGSSGSLVVNAVVNRIRSTCTYPEDRLFLRRTAFVASTDGTDSATYRPGFDGGIWQVNQTMFQATKQCSNVYLQKACSAMTTELNIQWAQVQWSDLRKPLYSGLAAALYTLLTLQSGTMPGNVTAQAALWSRMYGRPASDFSSLVGLSNTTVCKKRIDLAVVLDSSGSVSLPDFTLMRRFAADVVDAFDVSGGNVRISNIVYASDVIVEFDLDDRTTSAGVKQGFLNTFKIDSGTATSLALDEARRVLYNGSRGARPDANKVVVLVTDGMSNSRPQTAASAKALRDAGATVFAVGVGNYDLTELTLVASAPNCSHVLTLTSFDVIYSILTEIQKSICEANIGFNTSAQGSSSNTTEVTYQRPAPGPTQTIVANVNCGILNIYISLTDPRPSPAVYDSHYLATPTAPAVLTTVQSAPQGTPVYITVIGTKLPSTADGLRNCSDFNWTIGVVPSKVVTVQCVENGVPRNCTSADLVGQGLCQEADVTTGLPNPCTADNLAKQILRYPYPYNPNKFLQCDFSGQYYVTSCPGGVTFNVDTRECGFTAPGSGSGGGSGGSSGSSTQPPAQQPLSANGNVSNPCTSQAIAQNQFYHTYSPDKTKFIQCDLWGNAWVMPCAPATQWSQGDYSCIHLTATAAPPSSPNTVTCSPGNTYLPDPCLYSVFYQCVSGKPVKMQCSAGLEFDGVNKVCNWPAAIKRGPKSASCP